MPCYTFENFKELNKNLENQINKFNNKNSLYERHDTVKYKIQEVLKPISFQFPAHFINSVLVKLNYIFFKSKIYKIE
jgi:hypothetical protein